MQTLRTLFLGYIIQIYIAFLSIILVPIYLNYIGTEAYGVLGFGLMLQGFIQLLDMGLAQTLMREVSRSRINVNLINSTYNLLLAGEKIFFVSCLLIVIILFITSQWLSTDWLRTEQLSHGIIKISIIIAAILAGLRLYCNFYRSGLLGLGYSLQKWTNIVGAIFATLRYLGSLPLLAFTNFGIIGLFTYQLAISLIELIVYRLKISTLLKSSANIKLNPFIILRQHYKMLSTLAIISWLWILLTQLDKFFLSHWLTLSDYGIFNLGVTGASIISLVSTPIGQLLQPHFNILAAQKNRLALIDLYIVASQYLTFFFALIASVLALFAESILFLWTGNLNHAQQASPILFWYSLGNMAVALLMLPFMLQYAIGNLHFHFKGNVIFAAVWLPSLAWTSYNTGGVGAGITWFIGNFLFLIIWTSYTHNKLFPELPKAWLIKNIIIIVIPTFAIIYCIKSILQPYFIYIKNL